MKQILWYIIYIFLHYVAKIVRFSLPFTVFSSIVLLSFVSFSLLTMLKFPGCKVSAIELADSTVYEYKNNGLLLIHFNSIIRSIFIRLNKIIF